ncbi:glycosyltransferase family 2 protein [Paenibacillus soyae]|uniref:Glycosyltransferase family 2 protein n=1 Tax=Paenibacillus soyae TaxID=2969249 RepID=A0A9X2SBK9_9BACL|nr:glycosyltransferase family 2 protein [Paenibacillus soyae]MCR2807125.1 glycosyltransferase family 2 protein [Paenibacillus soyae]
MMGEQRLVSIVMPAYNRAVVMVKAIESIRKQSYPNWELIVVDDRSTDRTKELVLELAKQDARIRYVMNYRSKGPGGARNCGILAAQGELLAFLDSDDLWFPHHLKDSLDNLERTGADVSFALWVEQHGDRTIHSFEQKAEQRFISQMRKRNETAGDAIVFREGLFEQFLMQTRNFFQLNTMVFRRDMLADVGLINEQFGLGEDTTYLLRFFDRFRISLIVRPHAVYTQSPDSVYYFCDRWKLDPDSLGQNRELLSKFEALGLKSVKVRVHIRSLAEKSAQLRNRKKWIRKINADIACKYYTLSYLYRFDREKALGYCRKSIRSRMTLFNLLLMARLKLSMKGSSFILKRAVDLW